jgi:NADP-dependent 3-hydroxy acid dehydrogenase YdfG
MLDITLKFPRKRAFVTGAASGLGRAYCRALAQDGWTIAMCDVNESRLAEAVDEVASLGAKPLPYNLDVTNREQYQQVIKDFLDEAGGVDLVFNNAGVAGGGAMSEFSLEDWDWLIGINLMGVVNGCHFFLPILRGQRSGHFINTASAAALFPVPHMSAYCAAKAAVKMISEIMHNELYDTGVGVTVLMPEFFQTQLYENTRGPNVGDAKRLITKSRYTADQVAVHTLNAVAAGDLWVTFPKHIRVMWWINRLSPKFFNKLLRKESERRMLDSGQA